MKKKSKIFRNLIVDKKELKKIILDSFYKFGKLKACALLDHLKEVGFFYATKAGVSLSIEDLRVPPAKPSLMRTGNQKMKEIVRRTDCGEITEVERFQKIINLWSQTSESLKHRIIYFLKKTDPLNPIYMMAFSGARGNILQVRQLIGMRGLMSDSSGEIIDLPISSNFREGLTIGDYIISAYGARKGIVDTSLKTADSGYLTRRLIDVAQDIIIKEVNCKTITGVKINLSSSSLRKKQKLIGRVLAKPVYNPITNNLLGDSNDEITSNLEKQIKILKISNLYIRSPLTCRSTRSVCQKCYGWDLSSEKLVQLGEAVGILAAQSIGEPGTQLTMRTFHTGGVFSREKISRQICSKVAGQAFFSKDLPLELKLNQYGELLPRTNTIGKMFVIDYFNQVHILKVFANTIFLINDQTYLQEDEPLMELPSNKVKDNKAIKYISASHSGEIIFENNPVHYLNLKTANKLIWILSGQRYQLPIQSELKIKPLLRVFKSLPLATTKIINLSSGIIFISKSILNNHLRKFQILQDSTRFDNLNFYLTKKDTTKKNTKDITIKETKDTTIKDKLNTSLTAYISKNILMELNLTSLEKNLKYFISIGHLKNLTNRLKTGGILCFLNYRFQKKSGILNQRNQRPKEFNQNELRKGCTVFYIPEVDYHIGKDKKGLKVKIGDFIKPAKEIFTDIFSSISGTIYIRKSKKKIKKIKIKPGTQVLIPKKRGLKNPQTQLLYYKKYHQQIYYPGEILFDDYKINQLTYVEIIQTPKKFFLLLRPLIRYELVQPKFNFFNLICQNNSRFEVKVGGLELEIPIKKFTKIIKPINLWKRSVLVRAKIRFNNLAHNLTLEITKKNYAELNFIRTENISIAQTIPKEIEKLKGFFIPLIENKQFVEPYTILATINVLNSQNLETKPLVQSIKEIRTKKKREILLINELDYQSIFYEDKFKIQKTNIFLKKGEKIGNNLISSKSGLISHIIGSKIFLRLAQPYLFSNGAKIKRRDGFVYENEQLGQIVYERERTDDIVQGLPKIEEFLEARKPKFSLTINSRPGIVTDFESNEFMELEFWIGYKKIKKSKIKYHDDEIAKNITRPYSFNYLIKNFIRKFQFLNIAQAFNEEDLPINPHIILNTYFSYYESLKFIPKYESAYRSFKKVQGILLESVQNIYHSQGVYISDKHLELIIRKMTMKVEVLLAGGTSLLFSEIIDLTKVDYINRCLDPEQKSSADYQPILLGITKASLKSHSFISAASFQETTKVLTESAIHGRTDWLQGLKENVVVGRLIPAGTGYNRYNDVSHRLIRIPTLELPKKKLLEIKKNKIKTKYTKLKKKLQFNIFF